MLDHDALSFSLVPFCYGVCPFVNQLHPLPSATSGIPDHKYVKILAMIEFDFCLLLNYKNMLNRFLWQQVRKSSNKNV
jgi:hypothetical protein